MIREKAEQFAGEKVKLTGTIDKANNTVHVAKIAKDLVNVDSTFCVPGPGPQGSGLYFLFVL